MRDNPTDDEIRRFLGDGSGDDSGDDSGDGSGDGSGYGYGDGSGDGSGDGYGNGAGYGSGDGSGVSDYCGHTVWMIDDMPTLIYSVHGSYARGAILHSDLTLQPCYIARVGNSLAHGDTLRDARQDAESKDLRARPVEERVAAFVAAHPDPDAECAGRDLYDWHNLLTGSCRAGRDAWCINHGLSPALDRMTVREFLRLTADAYGGEVIRAVAERYKSCETYSPTTI